MSTLPPLDYFKAIAQLKRVSFDAHSSQGAKSPEAISCPHTPANFEAVASIAHHWGSPFSTDDGKIIIADAKMIKAMAAQGVEPMGASRPGR